MTSTFYASFDKLGAFFTSLAAVIIGMLVFIGYRFFEVYTLFERHLPMDADVVWVAGKLIAFVFVFTMLLIAVNIDKVHPEATVWGTLLGALITLFVNLYFWEVWHGDMTFKVIVSVITAAFDAWFGHLFVIKLREREAYLWASKEKARERVAMMKLQDALTCKKCGVTFKSQNALNGHSGRCKA